MSFVTRQAAHCDVCGHEWLTSMTPVQCAKCKSRKWNNPPDILDQALALHPEATGVALASAQGRIVATRERTTAAKFVAEVTAVPLRMAEAVRPADLLKSQTVELVEHDVVWNASPHDPKTCRLYKCGMCAAAKDAK